MEENRENRGRPTLMTDEKVKELEGYFSIGATDLEACFLAGISKQTLYNYQENNPDFVDRKEALKNMPKYKAKKNIVGEIDKGDKETSKWYLERKDREFKNKTDITTDDESINPLLVKFIGDDQQQGNDNTNRIQEPIQ
ncbi:hypothetical protein [Methanoculleus sp.]|uniref:hypothetical protein n=1 Tax=Methanoculleus sp. TaxID=90427 RepID=UPI0025FCFB4E|nr:hypothetical protein [Methanoculleus sp.]MCK9320073.1 helix-turn-helix domain-containing protein [Methanoculleus sp.]